MTTVKKITQGENFDGKIAYITDKQGRKFRFKKDDNVQAFLHEHTMADSPLRNFTATVTSVNVRSGRTAKIYLTLEFEQEVEAVKLTVEQIEAKLGYPVEIIADPRSKE